MRSGSGTDGWVGVSATFGVAGGLVFALGGPAEAGEDMVRRDVSSRHAIKLGIAVDPILVVENCVLAEVCPSNEPRDPQENRMHSHIGFEQLDEMDVA